MTTRTRSRRFLFPSMNSIELRDRRRYLHSHNKQWPAEMIPVPNDQWPKIDPKNRIGLFRSRTAVAQVFQEYGVIRLSINRSALDSHGGWQEGFTWDELMTIKHQCGYGEQFAVEAYPEDSGVVNVANMRHLWILPERPAWAWVAGLRTETAASDGALPAATANKKDTDSSSHPAKT